MVSDDPLTDALNAQARRDEESHRNLLCQLLGHAWRPRPVAHVAFDEADQYRPLHACERCGTWGRVGW